MNKRVKKGAFLVLGVVLCLALVNPVFGQGMTAKQLLADINQKWSNIKDIQADMATNIEEHGGITKMEGIFYQKGKLQRIEISMPPEMTGTGKTGEPFRMLMVFDGKIVWQSLPAMNMVTKVNFAALEIKEAPFFYSFCIPEVSYQVSEKSRDGKEYYCLESTDISQFFQKTAGTGVNFTLTTMPPCQKIVLWVNKTSLVTERGEFYCGGEKPALSLEVKNVKTNQNLSPELFVFKVPKGAKVTDMTQSIKTEMKKMAMEEMAAGGTPGGLAEAREEAKKSVCRNNLKQISLALHMYACDHGDTFPENLSHLNSDYIADARVFICPCRVSPVKEDVENPDICYEYVSGMTEEYDANCMVAYDREGNHKDGGRNVLFLDGHVKWVPKEEWPSVWRTHTELVGSSKKVIVVLDPAFGGEETGAIGPWGLEEKNVVLEIALEVERMISKQKPDIKTYLTRTEDKSISQKEREVFIKVHNPTLIVRFRLNSSNNKEREGFSVRYNKESEESKRLAEIISTKIAESIVTPNEGIKPDEIYKNIQVPVAEVFFGYITDSDIEANLRIPEVREAIADGIYKSILQFLE